MFNDAQDLVIVSSWYSLHVSDEGFIFLNQKYKFFMLLFSFDTFYNTFLIFNIYYCDGRREQ